MRIKGTPTVTLILLFLFPVLTRAEVITYDIRKWGASIGKATLTFAGESEFEGRHLALIVFKSEGLNFYDEEKIYVTPDTLFPVAILRDLNIFGKKEKITEHYSEGKIEVSKEAGGKKTGQTLQKPGIIDNIYGFIYRYRRDGSFKIGDELDLRLPTKDIKIKVVKNMKVFAAGKYFDGAYMQSDPAGYQMWFDAGPKKLPLRIVGATGFASTLMIMKEYKE